MSVVVPFAGGAPEARSLLEAFAPLQLAQDDELILVDNSLEGAAVAAVGAAAMPAARAVRAMERRSSYYARNAGARTARGEWLLFVDADCSPVPGLLDEYFAEPVPEDVGAVAGGVAAVSSAVDGVVARHARSRPYLDQASFLADPRGGFAATANLLVRRNAWERLGGFCEVRSGGDVDFSWRLVDAGHAIALRPTAMVLHHHRQTLGALVRQRIAYGGGERWLARRWPERRRLRQILPAVARRAAAAMRHGARGEGEASLFSLLDAVAFGAEALGWVADNSARPWPDQGVEQRS